MTSVGAVSISLQLDRTQFDRDFQALSRQQIPDLQVKAQLDSTQFQRDLRSLSTTVIPPLQIKTQLDTAGVQRDLRSLSSQPLPELSVKATLDSAELSRDLRSLTLNQQISVLAALDDAQIRQQLGKLGEAREVTFAATLDDTKLARDLQSIAATQKLQIVAQVDTSQVVQELRELTATQELLVLATLDDSPIQQNLKSLSNANINVSAVLDQSQMERDLDRLSQVAQAPIEIEARLNQEKLTRQLKQVVDGNYGAIELDVIPDSKGFDRKLRDLRQSIPAIDIDVTPDIKGFQEKLKSVPATEIDCIEVCLDPDVQGFKRKLEEIYKLDVDCLPVDLCPDFDSFDRKVQRGLKKRAFNTNIGIDTNDVGKTIEEAVTKGIKQANKKNIFSSLGDILTAPLKLAGSAFGGISNKLLAGLLEGFTAPLGEKIGTGVISGIESSSSEIIGSFDLITEKIGQNLTTTIQSALSKTNLGEKLSQGIGKFVEPEKVVAEAGFRQAEAQRTLAGKKEAAEQFYLKQQRAQDFVSPELTERRDSIARDREELKEQRTATQGKIIALGDTPEAQKLAELQKKETLTSDESTEYASLQETINARRVKLGARLGTIEKNLRALDAEEKSIYAELEKPRRALAVLGNETAQTIEATKARIEALEQQRDKVKLEVGQQVSKLPPDQQSAAFDRAQPKLAQFDTEIVKNKQQLEEQSADLLIPPNITDPAAKSRYLAERKVTTTRLKVSNINKRVAAARSNIADATAIKEQNEKLLESARSIFQEVDDIDKSIEALKVEYGQEVTSKTEEIKQLNISASKAFSKIEVIKESRKARATKLNSQLQAGGISPTEASAGIESFVAQTQPLIDAQQQTGVEALSSKRSKEVELEEFIKQTASKRDTLIQKREEAATVFNTPEAQQALGSIKIYENWISTSTKVIEAESANIKKLQKSRDFINSKLQELQPGNNNPQIRNLEEVSRSEEAPPATESHNIKNESIQNQAKVVAPITNNSASTALNDDLSSSSIFQSVAKQVALASGVKITKDQLPKVIADPFEDLSATATYDKEGNAIRLNPQAHKELKAGNLSEHSYEALIHELRHAIQFAFGGDKSGHGTELLEATEVENQKLGSRIEHSTNNVRAQNPDISKNLIERVRGLETDAYVFTDRHIEQIIKNVVEHVNASRQELKNSLSKLAEIQLPPIPTPDISAFSFQNTKELRETLLKEFSAEGLRNVAAKLGIKNARTAGAGTKNNLAKEISETYGSTASGREQVAEVLAKLGPSVKLKGGAKTNLPILPNEVEVVEALKRNRSQLESVLKSIDQLQAENQEQVASYIVKSAESQLTAVRGLLNEFKLANPQSAGGVNTQISSLVQSAKTKLSEIQNQSVTSTSSAKAGSSNVLPQSLRLSVVPKNIEPDPWDDSPSSKENLIANNSEFEAAAVPEPLNRTERLIRQMEETSQKETKRLAEADSYRKVASQQEFVSDLSYQHLQAHKKVVDLLHPLQKQIKTDTGVSPDISELRTQLESSGEAVWGIEPRFPKANELARDLEEKQRVAQEVLDALRERHNVAFPPQDGKATSFTKATDVSQVAEVSTKPAQPLPTEVPPEILSAPPQRVEDVAPRPRVAKPIEATSSRTEAIDSFAVPLTSSIPASPTSSVLPPQPKTKDFEAWDTPPISFNPLQGSRKAHPEIDFDPWMDKEVFRGVSEGEYSPSEPPWESTLPETLRASARDIGRVRRDDSPTPSRNKPRTRAKDIDLNTFAQHETVQQSQSETQLKILREQEAARSAEIEAELNAIKDQQAANKALIEAELNALKQNRNPAEGRGSKNRKDAKAPQQKNSVSDNIQELEGIQNRVDELLSGVEREAQESFEQATLKAKADYLELQKLNSGVQQRLRRNSRRVDVATSQIDARVSQDEEAGSRARTQAQSRQTQKLNEINRRNNLPSITPISVVDQSQSGLGLGALASGLGGVLDNIRYSRTSIVKKQAEQLAQQGRIILSDIEAQVARGKTAESESRLLQKHIQENDRIVARLTQELLQSANGTGRKLTPSEAQARVEELDSRTRQVDADRLSVKQLAEPIKQGRELEPVAKNLSSSLAASERISNKAILQDSDVNSLRGYNNEIEKTFKVLGQKAPGNFFTSLDASFSLVKGKALDFLKGFLSLQAFFLAQNFLSNFSSGVLEAQIKLDNLVTSLKFATGSSEEGAKSLAFIRAEVDRLRVPLQASEEGFSHLAAATHGTQLQGNTTREVFRGVSEAATVLGLTADQTGEALAALTNIASKGVVQTDDLRDQLGTKIPGALGIAARAMGVTEAQLTKLLETGQIAAADLFPKLGKELHSEFGGEAQGASQNTQSALFNFQNSTESLKESLGGGIGSIAQPALNTGSFGIKLLADNIEFASSAALAFGLNFVVGFIKPVGKAVGQLPFMQVGLAGLKAGFNAVKGALAELLLGAAAFEVIAELAKTLFTNQYGGELTKSYDDLAEAANRAASAVSEANKRIAEQTQEDSLPSSLKLKPANFFDQALQFADKTYFESDAYESLSPQQKRAARERYDRSHIRLTAENDRDISTDRAAEAFGQLGTAGDNAAKTVRDVQSGKGSIYEIRADDIALRNVTNSRDALTGRIQREFQDRGLQVPLSLQIDQQKLNREFARLTEARAKAAAPYNEQLATLDQAIKAAQEKRKTYDEPGAADAAGGEDRLAGLKADADATIKVVQQQREALNQLLITFKTDPVLAFAAAMHDLNLQLANNAEKAELAFTKQKTVIAGQKVAGFGTNVFAAQDTSLSEAIAERDRAKANLADLEAAAKGKQAAIEAPEFAPKLKDFGITPQSSVADIQERIDALGTAGGPANEAKKADLERIKDARQAQLNVYQSRQTYLESEGKVQDAGQTGFLARLQQNSAQSEALVGRSSSAESTLLDRLLLQRRSTPQANEIALDTFDINATRARQKNVDNELAALSAQRKKGIVGEAEFDSRQRELVTKQYDLRKQLAEQELKRQTDIHKQILEYLEIEDSRIALAQTRREAATSRRFVSELEAPGAKDLQGLDLGEKAAQLRDTSTNLQEQTAQARRELALIPSYTLPGTEEQKKKIELQKKLADLEKESTANEKERYLNNQAIAVHVIEEQTRKEKNRSDLNIANLEHEKSQQELVNAEAERSLKLATSRNDLRKAIADAGVSDSQTHLDAANRVGELRKRLDEPDLAPQVRSEIRSQIAGAGISPDASELQFVLARQRIEDDIATKKEIARRAEEDFQVKSLQLDLQKQRTTVQTAEFEAEIARLKAEQYKFEQQQALSAAYRNKDIKAQEAALVGVAIADKQLDISNRQLENAQAGLKAQDELNRNAIVAQAASQRAADNQAAGAEGLRKQSESLERVEALTNKINGSASGGGGIGNGKINPAKSLLDLAKARELGIGSGQNALSAARYQSSGALPGESALNAALRLQYGAGFQKLTPEQEELAGVPFGTLANTVRGGTTNSVLQYSGGTAQGFSNLPKREIPKVEIPGSSPNDQALAKASTPIAPVVSLANNSVEQFASGFKSALRGVEQKLDSLLQALGGLGTPRNITLNSVSPMEDLLKILGNSN